MVRSFLLCVLELHMCIACPVALHVECSSCTVRATCDVCFFTVLAGVAHISACPVGLRVECS